MDLLFSGDKKAGYAKQQIKKAVSCETAPPLIPTH